MRHVPLCIPDALGATRLAETSASAPAASGGSATPAGPPISHEGQEFVFILDGSIELFYDGRTHRLDKGDSAYIDASKPHTFHGVGEAVAKMVAVVSS